MQVGAFASSANAARLRNELERRGFSADVSEMMMHGRVLYRVRVGRYSSRSEAEAEAARLKTQGFPSKVVP